MIELNPFCLICLICWYEVFKSLLHLFALIALGRGRDNFYFATIFSFVISDQLSLPKKRSNDSKTVLLIKIFSFVSKTSNKKNNNNNRTPSACTVCSRSQIVQGSLFSRADCERPSLNQLTQYILHCCAI